MSFISGRSRLLKAFLSVAALGASLANAAEFSILSFDGRFVPSAPTHLLVAGAPNELHDGFFRSAVTRAHYLKGHFPERQILVLIPSETFGNMDEKLRLKAQEKWLVEGAREDAWIKTSGMMVNQKVPVSLSRAELLRIALSLRQIKSFEIFAHSSWVSGAAVGSKSFVDRFPFAYPVLTSYSPGAPVDLALFEPGIANLALNFADDGYSVIWGCNSGWTIAPMLSKIWRVPVFGSLTFADFEALHKDGNFYMRDYGFPNGPEWGTWPWANKNEAGFPDGKVGCDKACLRMKPNNFPYQGSWGNYNKVKDPLTLLQYEGGGLGYMKAFCNFTQGRRQTGSSGGGMFSRRTPVFESADTTCYRGLGHFMMAQVGPGSVMDKGFAAYKMRLLDFMCPHDTRDDRYNECVQKLEESEFVTLKGYSSFKGNPIECSTAGCVGQFRYQPGIPGSPTNAYGIDQPTVRLDSPVNKPSQFLGQLREYHMYLRAFTVYTGQAAPRVRIFPPRDQPIPRAIPVNEREPASAAAKSPKIDDHVMIEATPGPKPAPDFLN